MLFSNLILPEVVLPSFLLGIALEPERFSRPKEDVKKTICDRVRVGVRADVESGEQRRGLFRGRHLLSPDRSILVMYFSRVA